MVKKRDISNNTLQFGLLNLNLSVFENTEDPDQLASN